MVAGMAKRVWKRADSAAVSDEEAGLATEEAEEEFKMLSANMKSDGEVEESGDLK